MSHILDMISFLRGDVIANYQMHSLHAGRIGKQTNFLLVLPEERHGSSRSSKRSYLHLLCWKYAGTAEILPFMRQAGLVSTHSVHSVHNEISFTAYVIPYAKFVGIEPEENITVIADVEGASCETITITGYPYDPEHLPTVDLCEEFCVNGYVEDIFAYAMDCRTIFLNVTLFLHAKPSTIC